MIQTQRHDKDTGIWKITHQIELTHGLWHARVKAKNTEGWSNFSPDHDFEIKEIREYCSTRNYRSELNVLYIYSWWGCTRRSWNAARRFGGTRWFWSRQQDGRCLQNNFNCAASHGNLCSAGYPTTTLNRPQSGGELGPRHTMCFNACAVPWTRHLKPEPVAAYLVV